MKESFVINTGREKDILADVTYNNGTNLPVVIFCHGYKGYKDWGAWNQVAEEFAEKGFFFLKFNFSHNGGTIDAPIDFTDLEAFGKNTYSLEVKDLNSVLDFIIGSNPYSEIIDSSNITFIGHSRGGGIVALVGASRSEVKNVISWAGVSDYASRFPKEEAFEKWKEKGVFYVVNGRTKQNMPHYFSFYEDYEENKEELDILKAVPRLKSNHLIIHGDSDEAVEVSEAEALHNANPASELKIIAGAGHTFGTKHPWEESHLPTYMEEVVKSSIAFIKK